MENLKLKIWNDEDADIGYYELSVEKDMKQSNIATLKVLKNISFLPYEVEFYIDGESKLYRIDAKDIDDAKNKVEKLVIKAYLKSIETHEKHILSHNDILEKLQS